MIKNDGRNSFKTFVDVFDDQSRVLSFGDDLDELVVRQKIKPWKVGPFGLKVLRKRLLNLVQNLIAILKKGQALLPIKVVKNEWIFLGLFHQSLPVAIDLIELLFLHRHFLLQVIRKEDRLEVNPIPLTQEPLFEHVLSPRDFLFVFKDLFEDWFDVFVLLHHRDQRGQIVENFLDLVDFVQEETVASFVRNEFDFHLLQLNNDLFLQVFLQFVLFGGFVYEGLDLLNVFADSHSE